MNPTDLMTALGLSNLPEDKQKELYERLGSIIMQGAMIRAIDSLDDAAQEGLDAFIAKNPEDHAGILQYIQEQVPEFQEYVADEIARIKASAADLAQKPLA